MRELESQVEGPVDSAEEGGGTTVVPGGDKEPESPDVSNETAEAAQGCIRVQTL